MRCRDAHRFVVLVLGLLCWSGVRAAQGQEFPWWSEPVPLTEINTAYHDKAPFLSSDGLTLYFAREDEPGWGPTRLFQATRASLSDPFDSVEEVAGLSDAVHHVSCPWVSSDGLRIYYYTVEGGRRWIKCAKRASVEVAWQPGSGLAALNARGSVANPTLTRDELTIVFSGYDLSGGRGGWDVWLATRTEPNAPFGDIVNLTTLNTGATDAHPSITPDGLTLYFDSDRSGVFQIFRSRRSVRGGSFRPPTHLATLDTCAGNSAYPHLSADGETFLFTRRQLDGKSDIFISHQYDRHVNRVEVVRDPGAGPVAVFETIQGAIDAAQDGDVVNVFPGVFREAITFAGKAVTVQSIEEPAVLEAPDEFAVSFLFDEGPDSVLKNVVITGSCVGIFIFDASPTITNVTVAGNEYGVEAYREAEPDISNCILWGNARSDLYGCCAYYSCARKIAWDIPGEGVWEGLPVFPPAADLPDWFGSVVRGPSWQISMGGSVVDDPLFADPDNGDYHLLSARGRYWPEHDVWVLDEVTSPCIDAGDPAADCSGERLPNGGRLNMGAYGGTAFASMSESPFASDFNRDRVVDANDLQQFTDVWEQEQEVETSVPRRR